MTGFHFTNPIIKTEAIVKNCVISLNNSSFVIAINLSIKFYIDWIIKTGSYIWDKIKYSSLEES